MAEARSPVDNYLTSVQIMDMSEKRFGGRRLTISQLNTGVRNGHLSFIKLGNVRLYPADEVRRWLKRVEVSRTDDSRLRVRSIVRDRGRAGSTPQPTG